MHNSVELKWWGVKLCLDETNTTNLLALIDSGSDATALLMLVDPELKSKLVLALSVALVKIGAKVIKNIDESGGKKGVCISHPWVGPVPGWVVAQES